jgi:hypothetical protein
VIPSKATIDRMGIGAEAGNEEDAFLKETSSIFRRVVRRQLKGMAHLLLPASMDNVMLQSGRAQVYFAALTMSLSPLIAAAQSTPDTHRDSQALSCSLPGIAANSDRKLTTDDLVAAYNAQAALIHTVRASLILRGEGVEGSGPTEDNSRPIPTTLTFRSPTLLRMTGVIPFSARRVFDLASDGRQFRLLVQEKSGMRVIVGPVDAPQASTNFKENIRPQMALEAIRWLPARLKGPAVPESTGAPGIRTIDVELQTSTGKRMPAQLEFDLHTGTLTRLILLDPVGKQASEVDYSDWQKATEASRPGSQACFPRRIFVTQPKENRKIEMKFLSVQLNVPVESSQFQFVPPPGATVTRVGTGAGRSGTKP